jgi:membrane protein implicated in regulation of membrane protease activity
MKDPSSQDTIAWDTVRYIVRVLRDHPILLFGIVTDILLIIAIATGQIPLDKWTITIAAFLFVFIVALIAYMYFERPKGHIWLPPDRKDQLHLIECLIDQRVLATRETLFQLGAHKFDDDYWTNLDIDFTRLEKMDGLIKQFAEFIVAQYLEDDISTYVALDPVDFRAQDYTMGVVRKTAAQAGLPLVGTQMVKSNQKLVVIAGVYSESLKAFLNDYASSVHLAIILLSPTSQHLANELKPLPLSRVKPIVSVDFLANIPETRRRVMLSWGDK